MNLDALLKSSRTHNASDVHIIVGMPPVLRIDGEIVTAKGDVVTPELARRLVYEYLNDEQKKRLEEDWQLCFSTMFGETDRARITIYYRNGCPELSIRLSEPTIRSREELHLPSIIDELARKPNGLIILTGPTGVGKTTTFHYMIDRINSEVRRKIITIEDPVEYTHSSKRSIVIQQEVLTDVHTFHKALIHVLRQEHRVRFPQGRLHRQAREARLRGRRAQPARARGDRKGVEDPPVGDGEAALVVRNRSRVNTADSAARGSAGGAPGEDPAGLRS